MHHIGVHLNALRAFEAAGRLSSISRAAEELSVSHSTISHHVKGLETTLGVELFVRRDRSVVLTEAGEKLLPTLTLSFSSIAGALHSLQFVTNTTPLKVTVTPSFANKWLIPNLRRFRAANNAIDVQLKSSLALADFDRENFDVGIRAGRGDWAGFNSELLLRIHMTPVCSPSLLKESKRITDPQSLRNFTLIHADVGESGEIKLEWREWLQAVGADDIDCSGGLSFHDPGLALQAAIDGLGIAMGYVELAEADIESGRLVRPFDTAIAHPWSYYVITPNDRPEREQVQLFCNWLHAEVSRSS